MFVLTQDHATHRIPFQVQGQTIGISWKFDHFTLHDIAQAVNPGDTVGKTDNGSLRTRLRDGLKILDAAFDQLANFGGVELHKSFSS